MATSIDGLVPITRSFLAQYYDKYPLDPLPDDVAMLIGKLGGLCNDLLKEFPLTSGEETLAREAQLEPPHKIDENMWRNREHIEEILFLLAKSHWPRSLQQNATPEDADVAAIVEDLEVMLRQTLKTLELFQLKNADNVFNTVMTYMPQDFRGSLIRQQRERSERNRQAEVDALVKSGGSIHDRYALLWKQQMERRRQLAQLGSAVGVYKTLVKYLVGVPQVLLDFIKQINDDQGPMEEQRHRYGPSLYSLTKMVLSIHLVLLLLWGRYEERKLQKNQLSVIQQAVQVYASEFEKFLKFIGEVFANSPFFISAEEAGAADIIFKDLQDTLSTHRGEVAHFTQELRERFRSSLDHAKEMSTFVIELLDKLSGESRKLQNHTGVVHETQMISIAEFQKVYEEQSRSEAEKLIADVTSLLSSHMHRQTELVNGRLVALRDANLENKAFLDEHVLSVEGVTTDAKRKWEEFSSQAQHYPNDGSVFSASKHCRMELLLQQCVNTVDAACQQVKKTHTSVNEMSSKHVVEMDALIRTAIECNEQHDAEVSSARCVAEDAAARNTKDIQLHCERVLEHERESTKGVLDAIEAQSATLQRLHEDHMSSASEVNRHAENTFQNSYMDYEPTGETPLRSEPDVPSKGTIESLRAMPIDTLLEEFRENNPYESPKEKPSLIPRSPLIQLN